MFDQVQTQLTFAICPDCGQSILLRGKAFLGRPVTCPHCARQLAVNDTAPLELGWAYEEWDVDQDDW